MIDTESRFAGLTFCDREPARRDFGVEFLVVGRIQLVTRQLVLRGRTLTRSPIRAQFHRFLTRVGL